ncbi:UNKNOWN [Stylonychia lemnae]|uniref:Uncharacterized protein n=1 Tax=Stylonychia lemnae TaxID=5949 RepID=A0A078AYB2_STYLE|nr:UNKNOWN [Stylonychia lemnae]|eukprot:CDW87154.1 UNKNOWN [Stylonychia lemnae]
MRTRDPADSMKKAIEFVFHGTVGSQTHYENFMATIHTQQIPATEYDIYKNKLKHDIFVSGIDDQQMTQDVKQSLQRLCEVLGDWTNNNLYHYSSEQFYAMHLVTYVLTRIAGTFHTNGQSCFLDFSAQDIHLSTIATNPILNYYSDLPQQEPKFFGITISDKFVEEFIKELIKRKKRLNVLEYIELFPEFDDYSSRMRVGEVSDIFPNLIESYHPKKRFSLEINPKEPLEEGLQYSNQNTLVQFGYGQVNILIPLVFDILVGKTLFTWERIAQGYLGIGGLSKIKQYDDGTLKFDIKSNVRIQKLALKNISTSQNMVEEEATSMALGNLFLKSYLSPPLSYVYPLTLDHDQVKFDIKDLVERKIKCKFVPGFFDLIVYPLDFTQIPSEGLRLKEKYGLVSQGFNYDEQKRKAAWELKQKVIQQESFKKEMLDPKKRKSWLTNNQINLDWLL